ncbi:MAG: TIR domain-containing protein [Rhodobacteraceae bacterium]|nr:TIR domain-containing protein [Paracoccaceae bacterium]
MDFAKMPAQGTQQLSCHRIHLYLSHSWLYAEHGTTLSLWIFEERWQKNSVLLKFFNYSLPSDDPIHYESSIARCHVVVIPTGMYADHRQWIQLEIDGAIHYSKPILGVNPWGQQRSHSVVSNEAAMMVYWTPESVLDGIWELFDRRNQWVRKGQHSRSNWFAGCKSGSNARSDIHSALFAESSLTSLSTLLSTLRLPGNQLAVKVLACCSSRPRKGRERGKQ